jgi:hypothetical protein
MAEFALARVAPTAKLTGELHAQAMQNGRVLNDFVFRISADACGSRGGAGHGCMPVGTDDLRLADDGYPAVVTPGVFHVTFLCGKPALRK